MAKTKTTSTGKSVVDFVSTYVDNEQKKADSFRLIELMREWTGFESKMWGPPSLDSATTIISMQADTKVMLQFLGFLPEDAALYIII